MQAAVSDSLTFGMNFSSFFQESGDAANRSDAPTVALNPSLRNCCTFQSICWRRWLLGSPPSQSNKIPKRNLKNLRNPGLQGREPLAFYAGCQTNIKVKFGFPRKPSWFLSFDTNIAGLAQLSDGGSLTTSVVCIDLIVTLLLV